MPIRDTKDPTCCFSIQFLACSKCCRTLSKHEIIPHVTGFCQMKVVSSKVCTFLVQLGNAIRFKADCTHCQGSESQAKDPFSALNAL